VLCRISANGLVGVAVLFPQPLIAYWSTVVAMAMEVVTDRYCDRDFEKEVENSCFSKQPERE
jgi:hypothetical protein